MFSDSLFFYNNFSINIYPPPKKKLSSLAYILVGRNKKQNKVYNMSEGKYHREKAGEELGEHGVAVLNTMTRKDLLSSLLNFLDM